MDKIWTYRLGGHTHVCMLGSSQYGDSRGGKKKEGTPVGCRGAGVDLSKLLHVRAEL